MCDEIVSLKFTVFQTPITRVKLQVKCGQLLFGKGHFTEVEVNIFISDTYRTVGVVTKCLENSS